MYTLRDSFLPTLLQREYKIFLAEFENTARLSVLPRSAHAGVLENARARMYRVYFMFNVRDSVPPRARCETKRLYTERSVRRQARTVRTDHPVALRARINLTGLKRGRYLVGT